MERNLNLVLQVLQITNRVVVCLNLIDEAQRHGLEIDHRRLARDLGVPVVPTAARQKQGLEELLQAVSEVATGQTVGKTYQLNREPDNIKYAADQLVMDIEALYPDLPNARWVALRLLDGDERIAEALLRGELGDLTRGDHPEDADQPMRLNIEATA